MRCRSGWACFSLGLACHVFLGLGPHMSCALRAGGYLGWFPLCGFGFLGRWDNHPFCTYQIWGAFNVASCYILYDIHFASLGYSCLGSHARVLYGWRGDVFLFQMPVQGFFASEELFPAPLYVAVSSAVPPNFT